MQMQKFLSKGWQNDYFHIWCVAQETAKDVKASVQSNFLNLNAKVN